MKIKSLLVTLLLALLCVGLIPRPASARVAFSYFYDSLQPYGDWVDVDAYGYCWQPRGVDPGWRPYTDGYWAYTDAGWTWVSYEEFGSIVYHYGRWIRLEDVGWVWKPGYEWGPAWVSWRMSDDYVGWAPLPPEAEFAPDTGIGVWVDRDYDIGPSAYNFCEYRYFGAPVIRDYLLPRRQNVIIINSTVNITNITYIRGHDHGRLIFNGGPDYRRLSERAEHRIALLQLMRQTDGDWARRPRPELSRREGGQLFVIAPEIEPPHNRFAPPRVAREIRGPRIDKGWYGIADTRERDRIKRRYEDQTRGLDRRSAPVYPLEMQSVQATLNEARALREQARAQRDQMSDQERKAFEFNAKAAQAQQEVQIQQQKAAAEQHRKAAEFNAKAARAQQELEARKQEATVEQQRKAAEFNAKAARAQQELEARKQEAAVEQQRRAAEFNAKAARAQQEQQIQQQKAAEAVRAQQEQQARQQQATAEQQRRAAEFNAKAARTQQEQQAQQQQAAAEQQRRATEAVRAQQEQQARQQQAAAEQQRRAAEFNAKAARAQQEQQIQQQKAAAEQQRRAAEFNAKAARAQQEAAQRIQQAQQPQGQPTPDDKDPRKRKHRDRD